MFHQRGRMASHDVMQGRTFWSSSTGCLRVEHRGYHMGAPKPKTGLIRALKTRMPSSIENPQLGPMTALMMLSRLLPLPLAMLMCEVKVWSVS
jgi:hypothetical protein